MLGEAGEPLPPDDVDQVPDPTGAPEIPETPLDNGDAGGFVSPNVDNLLRQWQSGNHQSVALQVIQTLDSYRDFVELLFRIGHSGATELGTIMDELTANQEAAAEAPGDVPPGEEGVEEPPTNLPLGVREGKSEFDRVADLMEGFRKGGSPVKLLQAMK